MSHLRLVRPPGTKEPKKRQRYVPVFTPEEQTRLRAALRTARGLFGSWSCLADAVHLSTSRVMAVAHGHPFAGDLAVRLARALGKPLESLYAPPSDASCCPTCGARRTS